MTFASPGEFLFLVLMWWLMMAVMMLPVTVPWLRTLHRLSEGEGGGPLIRFGIGYFGVWLGFSLAAATLQTVLAANGLFSEGAATPAVAGALVLTAGLYQLSPLKSSCLKHCRSPMSFFLSKWHDGPARTLRLGAEHGLFCLGCCWALMLLGLAMGVMNGWWMALLAGIVTLENFSRHGRTVTRIVGLGLVVLSFSGCSEETDPMVCDASYHYGLTVNVTAAASGGALPEATVTITEGEYVEVLTDFGTGSFVGAGERPGVYTIEVTAPAHEAWTTTEVELGFDGCHVIAQAFDVTLQPS